MLKTRRVVPANIFIEDEGAVEEGFQLKSDQGIYLDFRCLSIRLKSLEAHEHFASTNIVERICLTFMHYPDAEKMIVTDSALDGLFQLEPNPDKQKKYVEMVMLGAKMGKFEVDDFKRGYAVRRPYKETFMTMYDAIKEIGKDEGKAEGEAEGEAKGKVKQLLSLLKSGIINQSQARTCLEMLVTSGEAPRELVDEALKSI